MWACNTEQSQSLNVTFEPLQSKDSKAQSLERATGIEPAFSAWEAEYGNCDDEPSCLIRARKSLAIQLKIYRQAYCGHTDDNYWPSTRGILVLTDDCVRVDVGPLSLNISAKS